jgi:sugar phosphate isomerase/epimerase
MMCAVGDFYHPSWIEPDPDARRARAEYTLACLNLAYQLKAPSISTEPGGPIPPGISREDAMHTFRQGLSLVLPEAQKLGIKLLIEPEPGLLVQNLYEFEELADSIASPALGLNLDLGHFYCLGQDLRLIIKHLKGRIDHIHLEDIGADRRHLHLIPGRGAIEFALIFEALEEINYSGWITIELYPYQETATEAAREALQFVTRILQRS